MDRREIAERVRDALYELNFSSPERVFKAERILKDLVAELEH